MKNKRQSTFDGVFDEKNDEKSQAHDKTKTEQYY